jgi:hypothetical protein
MRASMPAAVTAPSAVAPSVPVAERLAAVSTALRKPVDQARAVVNSDAAEKALRAPAEWARAAADSPIWSRAREATAESAGNLRDQLVRWLPRLIAALAIVGIGAAAMRYLPSVMKSLSERVPAATAPAPDAAAAAAPRPTTGTLKIQSTPPGARVLIDGTVRGVTPLSVEGVAPGKHLVALESNVGAVQRSVTVTAGVVAEVDESIFAGFLTVYSPFELSITEGSRAFRADERNEIMLPAGRHDLRLSNRALGFEEIRSVDLTPGQRLTISVTPNSSVSVTANDAAEVVSGRLASRRHAAQRGAGGARHARARGQAVRRRRTPLHSHHHHQTLRLVRGLQPNRRLAPPCPLRNTHVPLDRRPDAGA